jgi:hypothetical protein
MVVFPHFDWKGHFAMRVRVLNGGQFADEKRLPRIVLVHGIDGFAGTWTRSTEMPAWLTILTRTMKCLVYVLEYDAAKFKFGKKRVQHQIESFSVRLLRELRKNDVLCNRTCFICHSYGGLLIKKSLSDSHLHERDYFSITRSKVKALIFLGTPHQGSAMASYAWPVARLLRIGTHGLADLRWNGRMMKMISHDFDVVLRSRKPPSIMNVREAKGIPLVKRNWIDRFEKLDVLRLPIVVTKESATLGSADELNFDAECDHLELPTFRYRGAERIAEAIQDFLNTAFNSGIGRLEP